MKESMVSIYMKQIEKIPLLSAAEEKQLLLKASKGDKAAKDKIVSANLRFVVKMANKFKDRGVDFEDLVCEGNLALLHAIDKIDVKKDVKFITYASFWIAQYMKAAIYAGGRSVAIPQNRPDQLKNPDYMSVSLDRPVNSEDSESPKMLDTLCDNKNMVPEEACIKQACLTEFHNTLKGLKPTEKYILEHHQGLNGVESEGLREIGEKVGVSRETIRQIENRVLAKLGNNKRLRESFVAA